MVVKTSTGLPQGVSLSTMSLVEEHDIDKRNAGCGAFVGDQLYIWGGETEDPIQSSSDSDDDSDSQENDGMQLTEPVSLPRQTDPKHPFDVFDVKKHVWTRQPTSGLDGEDIHIPAVGNGSTLTYHPGTNSLYLFGGWNDEQFTSDVYKINADDWVWEKVKLTSSIQPSPRYLTAVILHGDKICNFAGVGPPIVPGQDEGAKFIYYEARGRRYSFGWNDEYYEFDIISRSWEVPMSGKKVTRPPPCGAHIMTKFDPSRAVYFGGRRETGYTNEAYILDLDKKEFQGPLKSTPIPGQVATPLPLPRTFPTLTSLVDPELVGQPLGGHGPVMRPKLLLMWGKRNERTITDEVWLLDPLSYLWTKLDLGDLQPRSWHIAQPYYCHPNSTECRVVIFGGNVHAHASECSGDRVNTVNLKMLTFGVSSLQNLCILAAVARQNISHSSLPPHLQLQVISSRKAQEKHVPMKPKLCKHNTVTT